MAELKIEIDVNELATHGALRHLLERLAKFTGVTVTDIRVTWWTYEDAGGPEKRVDELVITTKSK